MSKNKENIYFLINVYIFIDSIVYYNVSMV